MSQSPEIVFPAARVFLSDLMVVDNGGGYSSYFQLAEVVPPVPLGLAKAYVAEEGFRDSKHHDIKINIDGRDQTDASMHLLETGTLEDPDNVKASYSQVAYELGAIAANLANPGNEEDGPLHVAVIPSTHLTFALHALMGERAESALIVPTED